MTILCRPELRPHRLKLLRFTQLVSHFSERGLILGNQFKISNSMVECTAGDKIHVTLPPLFQVIYGVVFLSDNK